MSILKIFYQLFCYLYSILHQNGKIVIGNFTTITSNREIKFGISARMAQMENSVFEMILHLMEI